MKYFSNGKGKVTQYFSRSFLCTALYHMDRIRCCHLANKIDRTRCTPVHRRRPIFTASITFTGTGVTPIRNFHAIIKFNLIKSRVTVFATF